MAERKKTLYIVKTTLLSVNVLSYRGEKLTVYVVIDVVENKM